MGERLSRLEGLVTLEPPPTDLEEIVDRAQESLRALAGRRLLVTGAAGFLGSYLCHAVTRANDLLLETPCRVICLDTFVTGSPERLESLAARADCVILNTSTLSLSSLDAEYVVHAASISSPPAYRRLPLETIEVNALGTWHLLRLAEAAGVESFLYLSSSEVYGDPEDHAIPTKEDYVGRVSFTGPRACYDESKRLAETLCRLYYLEHGVPVKVARPFNVYGPTFRLDDGRIVPDLMQQGLAGGPLVLLSDGTPTRSFCYVTDATVALLELLTSAENGEAFNVGTPEEVSILQLARLTAELFGIGEVRHEEPRDARYLVDNPHRRSPDITKITERIGWTPHVSLREGLRRTVAYYAALVASQ